MLVLGIESTCDETACAIVRDGREILSSVISSQIDLHNAFGGVVPELACRRHVEVMIPVIDQALKEAACTLEDIDLFAVANGPGLVGALLIGVNAAKALALTFDKPLIGINHVEAHLYAALMSHPAPFIFPAIGVVLSGGHTELLMMRSIGTYELIGKTVDDAIGEAFDKVAKILGLPYPGGPEIERLAKGGNPLKYPFKAGKVKGQPLNFSFSGLKTSVLYTVKGQNKGHASNDSPPLSPEEKHDIAASFQHVALQDIIHKSLEAARSFDCPRLLFGGGVTNNQRLRELFKEASSSIDFFWPSTGLSLDNAAMIAGLAFHQYKDKGKSDSLDLDALTRIPF